MRIAIAGLLAAWPLAGQVTDRPLRITVTEAYRVGGETAPDWAQFTDVRALGFGPGGELWVVDPRGRQIVRVRADGRTGRNLLRRGRGPGEFETPAGVAVLPDGSAVVADIPGRNLQRIDSAGRLVLGAPREGYLRNATFAWLQRDEFIGIPEVVLANGEWRLFAPSGFETFKTVPVLRFAIGGEAQVIVQVPYSPPPRPAVPFSRHAFHPELRWSVHGGRVAVAHTAEYDVAVYDAAGRVVARIARAIVARRPTRADMTAVRTAERAKLIPADGVPRMSGVGSGSGDRRNAAETVKRLEAGIAAMTFAERVPVINGLRHDSEGRLWVERTADVWGERPLLDVFSAAGQYLGTTQSLPRLPDAFGPDGRAAFIERDALDVPYVVVMRYRM